MRNAFPREFYINDGETVIFQQDDLIAYASELAGGIYAKGFSGKRAKPDWHYRFKTIERRDRHIAEWVASNQAAKTYKAEQKAARQATPRGLEVGDILDSHWGYDQTNIDYYQVTAMIGDCMVEICAIGCESEETMYMQGKSVPVPNRFIGKPMRKVAKNGYVRLNSYSGASKMMPVATVAGTKIFAAGHWTAYA